MELPKLFGALKDGAMHKSEAQIRHEEREHVKQTIFIKMVPLLTDEQREKLVAVLKEV